MYLGSDEIMKITYLIECLVKQNDAQYLVTHDHLSKNAGMAKPGITSDLE